MMEIEDLLALARTQLAKASAFLGFDYPDEAGRVAYLAAFNAARGYLLFLTDKNVKTHNGVQNQFYKSVQGDPRFDRELQVFLSRAYNLKAITDYESGPSPKIPSEALRKTIETATRLVDLIEKIIKETEKV